MTCTHFVAMFTRAREISNSSPSIFDFSIQPSLRFANMAAVGRSTVHTTFARKLGAALALNRPERHEALSRTIGMLSSSASFFSSIGKATADHPRAIVQFVPVRECGRRIIQRI